MDQPQQQNQNRRRTDVRDFAKVRRTIHIRTVYVIAVILAFALAFMALMPYLFDAYMPSWMLATTAVLFIIVIAVSFIPRMDLEVYDDSLVMVGEYTFTCGYQSLQTLLELPDPPTAVFSINYDMSLGLITAARERGLKLPEQLNIFSYDCIEICSLMSPPLPVVHQPAAQIGQTAGTYLLERLNGYDGPPRTMRLKSQLIF